MRFNGSHYAHFSVWNLKFKQDHDLYKMIKKNSKSYNLVIIYYAPSTLHAYVLNAQSILYG